MLPVTQDSDVEDYYYYYYREKDTSNRIVYNVAEGSSTGVMTHTGLDQ